jgi:RND family efflux transporter MFP subunit
VVAPYGGVVSARLVELGEMVTPGKPLMSGFDPAQMRVVVDVPQYRMADVGAHPQATVEIVSLNRQIKPASLEVLPTADARTHSTQVRANLSANEQGIYPGMFVRVQFTVGRAKKLLVPASAVLHRSEVTAVYVVDKGVARLRQVRLGEQSGGDIEVLAGLNEGEQVALDPVRAGMATKQN